MHLHESPIAMKNFENAVYELDERLLRLAKASDIPLAELYSTLGLGYGIRANNISLMEKLEFSEAAKNAMRGRKNEC